MDRKYIMTSLGYGIVGLVLGIYMAASKNHGHMVTHAHIMLVGFVVSFIYALCFKLWLNNSESKLAKAQYYLHQVGSLGLVIGLYLMYGNYISLETLDPILAISSIAVLISMILMKVLFIKAK
ncbi:MAG: TonB-dependent receptor [Kangiellaceae bacterium]|jgi:putative solute:sodium symporter small subunit